jgi:adenylate cyclase
LILRYAASAVSRYSTRDVALGAGVDEAYVDRLVQPGILTRAEDGTLSPSDVPRTRLVQTLERAGVPLDGIAATIRGGNLSLAFMDQPFYERFASLSPVTFHELSGKIGTPESLLMVVREAIGFGQPRPGDRVREDELRIASIVGRLLETGSRPEVVERLLRVWGESMRRIAEMEGDWWHTEVEMPLLESGMDEREMMETSHRLSTELASLQEQAVLEIYHAQHEHAATRNIVEDIESTLAKAGVHSRVDRPPAICFLDLTGYTRLTEERGTKLRPNSPASSHGW